MESALETSQRHETIFACQDKAFRHHRSQAHIKIQARHRWNGPGSPPGLYLDTHSQRKCTDRGTAIRSAGRQKRRFGLSRASWRRGCFLRWTCGILVRPGHRIASDFVTNASSETAAILYFCRLSTEKDMVSVSSTQGQHDTDAVFQSFKPKVRTIDSVKIDSAHDELNPSAPFQSGLKVNVACLSSA